MGGSVRVNFGPEFVYTPPRSYGWKPVAALKPFTKDEMKVRQRMDPAIESIRDGRGRFQPRAPCIPDSEAGGAGWGNFSCSTFLREMSFVMSHFVLPHRGCRFSTGRP